MKRSVYLTLLFFSIYLLVPGAVSVASVPGTAAPEPVHVTGGSITTLPVSGSLCHNSTVVVRFTTSGFVFGPTNVFTAQLSDASGNFNSPFILGSLPAAGMVGESYIFGLIPAVPFGSGYRIRVVSSDPEFTAGTNNGTDLTIKEDAAPPIPSITVNGPMDFCYGSATTFLTSSSPTGNLWFPGGTNTNPFIGVVASGCYYTQVTGSNGCATTSVPVCINVNTPIFTFLAYSKNDTIVTTADTTVTICEGDSAQIAIIIQGGMAPFDIFYQTDDLSLPISAIDVGEPFGTDHIYRFYVDEPGTYSVVGLTDNFPTNCGSNGNSGMVTVLTAPRPVTDFSYAPFCGSPSFPPVPAPGFLGGGVFSFNPDPGDGAVINPSTGVITDATIGSTYTVVYTVQGPNCEASSSTTFTVEGEDKTEFTIEPFCANGPSAPPVQVPGFRSGGVFSFLGDPGDGAQINPVTGIITNAAPNATYVVSYTSPEGLCQASSADTVTTLENPALSGTVTDTECGLNTGSISAAATGGTPDYTYSWTGRPETEPILSGLAAGTYTLHVVDESGCTDDTTFSIVNTNQPELVLEVVQEATCGNNNGELSLTINEGTGPFEISWQDEPGNSSSTRIGLAAGTYQVEVTDLATTCVVTASATIQNQGAPVATFTVTNTLCGQSTGAVNVTVTGGTGTITHHWSNGATTEDLSGLGAGTYTDTIRDENSCQVLVTATVINQNQFTASATTTRPSCAVPNSGSVTVTTVGGQGPFTYSWFPNTNSLTPVVNNLPAGEYTVVITAASCSATVVAVVPPAFNIVLSAQVDSATCGNSDGAIDLTVTGGSGVYTYLWTGPDDFTSSGQDISNLAAGTYSVAVRGATDTTCTASLQVTIVNKNQPVLSFEVTPSSCSDTTGVINLTIGGNGSGTYGFEWTGPNGYAATTQNIDSLYPGTYSVLVYDSVTTCSATGSATVIFANAPEVSATVVNTRCGNDNGLIDLTITGGTNPVVAWEDGPQTEDRINLAPGTYHVTVEDDNECVVRDTFEIAPSVQPHSELFVAQPSCGNDTGRVDLILINAQAPIIYVWRKDGVIFANTEDIFNLAPATYRVVATDANGCVVRDTAILAYQDLPELNTSVTHTPCGLAEGAINLTIDGGTPDYTIEWTGENEFTSSDEDISGLAAGCYQVTVTDSKGCIVSTSACVESMNEPQLAFETVPPSCNLDNGSVSVVITGGGVAPFTFGWTNPESTDSVITSLAAGTYTVRVRDANGCEVSGSVSLSNTGIPALSAEIDSSTCGNADGGINLTVTGGLPGYTFLWSNDGETTEDISGLAAGIYTVTVADTTGCEVAAEFAVSNSDAPRLSYTSQEPACNENNGSIDLTVQPAGTYIYVWTGNGVVPDAEDQTGLAAGEYKVVVSNETETCSDSLIITLQNANTITGVEPVITHATCGENNGSISLTITGGTEPLSFEWSCSAATTSEVTGLAPGSCEVLITDANGCEWRDTFEIQSAPGPAISAVVTDATCGACNGGITLTITGGTGAIDVLWNDDVTSDTIRTALCAGSYSVTVTDENNCTAGLTVGITATALPELSFTQINTTCGNDTGSIDVTVTGGTPPYTYTWTGPDEFTSSDEDLSGLASGEYRLNLTDSAGCEATLTVSIINSNQPTLSFEVTDANCGASTGSIILTVEGGFGPPPSGPPPPGIFDMYLWSGPDGFTASTKDLLNVPAGTYTVVVTSGACTTTGSATIGNTDAPSATIAFSEDTICEGRPVTLTINLTGTAPFTFSYSDGNTLQTITSFNGTTFTAVVNPAETTTYSLISLISDSDPSCPGMFPIEADTITVNPAPVQPVVTAEGPLSFCQGDSVVLTSSYAAGNTWSPGGDTTASITVTASGTYTVSVSNEFGCSAASEPLVIQVGNLPVVSAGNDATICPGQIVQLQGTGADEYLWSPSIGLTGTIISNPQASPPVTTQYTVTGTNACGSAVDTIVITVNSVVSADLGDDITICQGEEVILSAGELVDGAIYTWEPAGVIAGPANGPSVRVVTSTSVQVILSTIHVNTCSDRDTVQITVLTPPARPTLSAQGPTTFCEGGSVVLSAGTGVFIQWKRGAEVIAENVNQLQITQSGRYSVVLTNSDCVASSDTIDVTVSPVPQAVITPSGNPAICQGSCINLSAPVTGSTVTWTTPGGTQTGTSIQACSAGEYSLEVTENGCSASSSLTITENPLPLAPVITPGGPIEICENETATLFSSYPEGNQWLNNGVPLSGFTSHFILLNSAGNYAVQVTDANGCQSVSESVEIAVKPVSNLVVTATDSMICAGTTKEITLTASSGFTTYNWSTLETTQSIVVTAPGTYSLEAINAAGCRKYASIVIEEAPRVVLNLSSPVHFDDYNVTQKGAKDGSIDLSVEEGTEPYTYAWSSGQADEDLTGLAAGTYVVTVTDAKGCSATDSITLKEPGDIKLPNGFTPNGDGYNDFYVIKGIQGYPDNQVNIFNRWGNLVYSRNGYTNDWDGTSNDGKQLTDGTYFILVDLNQDNTKIQGFIDLRRK